MFFRKAIQFSVKLSIYYVIESYSVAACFRSNTDNFPQHPSNMTGTDKNIGHCQIKQRWLIMNDLEASQVMC